MVRRVVAAHDENGKSIVVSDGPAPFMSPEQSRQLFAALGNEQGSTFGKSAWSNRSNAPCDTAFVLIDGAFDADLAAKPDRH